MKHIKSSQFLFIDDDGQEKIFLREKYFEFVCLLITDFFNKKIIENEFHYYFISLLNNLEDYESVDYINHQIPYHWALSIIQNKHTTDSYTPEELEQLLEFSSKFDKQNNLNSFIIACP
ncbi:Uncharacterised protein [Chryseobacterium gleum]|uniref:Uncharacterized protein n=2 Tax=Chryseobacterium gleum TaxID=250 RepID=A0A3S4QY75_CHRGE|nr:hypothetical protein [Chryseobacterium gleum]EFK37707.1 hypothetical protein HMPREF0204_10480 [Chryseobacterium gleum ATCC 35910]QQY32814.1 hypothetical protein I6I60_03225 [Chryseobacterium gleum]VEE09947.1 Uncharacterised protein [Chryseobacterium gleum]